MEFKFFLADLADRNRLAADGTVQPAHECTPAYFDTPDEAYHHPAAAGLTVHSCPAAETVPGGIGEGHQWESGAFTLSGSLTLSQVYDFSKVYDSRKLYQ